MIELKKKTTHKTWFERWCSWYFIAPWKKGVPFHPWGPSSAQAMIPAISPCGIPCNVSAVRRGSSRKRLPRWQERRKFCRRVPWKKKFSKVPDLNSAAGQKLWRTIVVFRGIPGDWFGEKSGMFLWIFPLVRRRFSGIDWLILRGTYWGCLATNLFRPC